MSQTSLHKTMVASLCNFLAAGAIVACGSGLDQWKQYLNLTPGDMSWLNFLSANGAGAAIGAFFGGFIADRFGRSKTFSYNMLTYMVGVLLCCTAGSFAQLMLGTFITGIAAGTSIPASWTYISECSESGKRGRNIAFSQLAWGLGPAVVLMFGYLFIRGGVFFPFIEKVAGMFGINENYPIQVNVYTWRFVFFFLYVVAVIAWFLQRRLAPSDEWLANKMTIDKTKPLFSSLKLLFAKPYVKNLLLLSGMYLAWNLVAATMGFFQSYIYENVGNLPPSMTTRTLSDMWFLTCAITFAGAFYMDRFNHRHLLAGFVDVGILAWLLVAFVGIDSMAGLVLITILWGVQAGISVQLFFALWGGELFPFRYRAAAMGIMICIVRALSALGSSTFSDYMSVHIKSNPEGIIRNGSILMLIFFLISAAIAIHWAPNTQGKTMSQISDEMYGEDHTKEHYGE